MSPESRGTRAEAAYDAACNLCLVVLAVQGYRIQAGEGHHGKAIEAACAALGVSQGLYDRLDALREMRNGKYMGVAVSEEDLKDALGIRQELEDAVGPWLEQKLKEHPELRRS